MKNKKLFAIICTFVLVMVFSVTAFAGTGFFSNKYISARNYAWFGNGEKDNYPTITIQATLNISNFSGGTDSTWCVQYKNGNSWAYCTSTKTISKTGQTTFYYSPVPANFSNMRIQAIGGSTDDTNVSGSITY
jgi:hypothetical protein